MVLGCMPPPVLEAVRMRPCVPCDLGMERSLPSGYRMSDGLENLGKKNITHTVGWASKMLLTTLPEHDEKEIKRMQSPSEAPGVSDGHPHPPPPHQTHCLECYTSWGKKWMLVLVRRAILVYLSFISHPNQMDCGQRCMKTQSNEGQLWPLSMSKVETAIKPGFVSVWVDSQQPFTPIRAAHLLLQQLLPGRWPGAVPKAVLSFSQDQTCAMTCVCQTAQETMLAYSTASFGLQFSMTNFIIRF